MLQFYCVLAFGDSDYALMPSGSSVTFLQKNGEKNNLAFNLSLYSLSTTPIESIYIGLEVDLSAATGPAFQGPVCWKSSAVPGEDCQLIHFPYKKEQLVRDGNKCFCDGPAAWEWITLEICSATSCWAKNITEPSFEPLPKDPVTVRFTFYITQTSYSDYPQAVPIAQADGAFPALMEENDFVLPEYNDASSVACNATCCLFKPKQAGSNVTLIDGSSRISLYVSQPICIPQGQTLIDGTQTFYSEYQQQDVAAFNIYVSSLDNDVMLQDNGTQVEQLELVQYLSTLYATQPYVLLSYPKLWEQKAYFVKKQSNSPPTLALDFEHVEGALDKILVIEHFDVAQKYAFKLNSVTFTTIRNILLNNKAAFTLTIGVLKWQIPLWAEALDNLQPLSFYRLQVNGNNLSSSTWSSQSIQRNFSGSLKVKAQSIKFGSETCSEISFENQTAECDGRRLDMQGDEAELYVDGIKIMYSPQTVIVRNTMVKTAFLSNWNLAEWQVITLSSLAVGFLIFGTSSFLLSYKILKTKQRAAVEQGYKIVSKKQIEERHRGPHVLSFRQILQQQ